MCTPAQAPTHTSLEAMADQTNSSDVEALPASCTQGCAAATPAEPLANPVQSKEDASVSSTAPAEPATAYPFRRSSSSHGSSTLPILRNGAAAGATASQRDQVEEGFKRSARFETSPVASAGKAPSSALRHEPPELHRRNTPVGRPCVVRSLTLSRMGSKLNPRSLHDFGAVTRKSKLRNGSCTDMQKRLASGRKKLSWENEVLCRSPSGQLRQSDEEEMGLSCRPDRIAAALRAGFASFRSRGYIFDYKSVGLEIWQWALCMSVLYTAIYLPVALVFEEARWGGDSVVGMVLDVVFLVDIVINFRTSYHDRGYEVIDWLLVARQYRDTWFAIDLVASFPIDAVVRAAFGGDDEKEYWRLFKLCRLLRISRLLRRLDSITTGVNVVRIVQMIFSLVLIAHWLGVGYFALAIAPLKQQTVDPQTGQAWIWSEEAGVAGSTSLMYVCSLYWALSVMTNLKGLPAHESRQCFVESQVVLRPLAERAFTISTFLIGAIVYASLYGNINRFLQNMDLSHEQYRRKLQETAEFFRFHNVPPKLQKKIRAYMEFSFSVTKGINVEAIHSQLPAQLQLEVSVYLNMQMLDQVPIFKGLDPPFIKALVLLMQTSICIGGDKVCTQGDASDRMFFVKRGMLKMIMYGFLDTVMSVRTVKEGDFFGETALFTSASRTFSVVAVTDAVLLSLRKVDFEKTLACHPTLRPTIATAIREEYGDQGFDLSQLCGWQQELQKGPRLSCVVRAAVMASRITAPLSRRLSTDLGDIAQAARRSSRVHSCDLTQRRSSSDCGVVAHAARRRSRVHSCDSTQRRSSSKDCGREKLPSFCRSRESNDASQSSQKSSKNFIRQSSRKSSDASPPAAMKYVTTADEERVDDAQGPGGPMDVPDGSRYLPSPTARAWDVRKQPDKPKGLDDPDQAMANKTEVQPLVGQVGVAPVETMGSIDAALNRCSRISEGDLGTEGSFGCSTGQEWPTASGMRFCSSGDADRGPTRCGSARSDAVSTPSSCEIALSMSDPMTASIEMHMSQRHRITSGRKASAVLTPICGDALSSDILNGRIERGSKLSSERGSDRGSDRNVGESKNSSTRDASNYKLDHFRRQDSGMSTTSGGTTSPRNRFRRQISNLSTSSNSSVHARTAVNETSMLMGQERIAHAMDVGRQKREIAQQTAVLKQEVQQAVASSEERMCRMMVEMQAKHVEQMALLTKTIEKMSRSVGQR